MTVTATAAVQSCPRCSKPISIGQGIEVYRSASLGRGRRWAHISCSPNSSPAEPSYNRNSQYVDPLTQEEPDPEPIAPAIRVGVPGGIDITALVNRVLDGRLDGFKASILKVAEESNEAMQRLSKSIGAIVGKAVIDEVARQQLPRTIELRTKGVVVGKIEKEVSHACIDDIVLLLSLGKNVLLVGPTGCGKTHLAQQAARLKGLAFGIVSCSGGLTEAKLFGRPIPNVQTGEVVFNVSDTIRLYEFGGLVCFDEIDGLDPNMAMSVNSMIANGIVSIDRQTLPPGMTAAEYRTAFDSPDPAEREKCRGYGPLVRRHPDFCLVATANTWGHGASREYCGRNALDEATLDRFRVGQIELTYSEAIERSLCPNSSLLKLLQGWREKIMANRLQKPLSTRFIGDAYLMMTAGWSIEKIEATFFSGWKRDEQFKVLGREAAKRE